MADRTASGTRVAHYAEIGSTNAEAMRLGASGQAGPLWVVADEQSGGRGRSGRAWVSTAGNLFASYLFSTTVPIATAHQLSLVAGVATFEAISGLGLGRRHGLRLKWPNDILVGTSKVGGILVESSTMPTRGDLTVVIGVGLNLASHPQIEGREVTSLAANGCVVAPAGALDALDVALISALERWDGSRGFAAIRAAWLERCGPIGERISVQIHSGTLDGAFAGLDDDGALLIELDGGERQRCTYGDVTLT